MHKRLLSVVLTLALLAGALSCGLLLPGSADAPQPEKTDKGGYVVQTVADKDTAYLDWLTAVMARTNALKGVTPQIYAAVDANGGMSGEPAGRYHQWCDNTNAKYLYDGLIPGINAAIDNTQFGTTNNKIFWQSNTYPYLYIDLGKTVQLSQLLLAAGVGEEVFASVSIYAGTDAATLVKADNLIAQESDFYSAVITPDAAVTARYVAIHFAGYSGNMARISELGLYIDQPYTVRSLTGADDADEIHRVVAQTNVAAASSRNLYSGEADFGNTAKKTGTVSDQSSAMMDGVVPGVCGCEYIANGNKNKGGWANASANYLFLDFGKVETISQMLVAGVYKTTTEPNVKLGTATIYLGNDPAKLVSEPVMKFSVTENIGAIITPYEPVEAQYAAMLITDSASNYARISELGFYTAQSGSDEDETEPKTDDKGSYVIQSIADPRTTQNTQYADWLTGITSQSNILSGVNHTLYTAADLSADATFSGAAYLYDGIIPGIHQAAENTQFKTTNYKAFWNKADSSYLYYDLCGTAQIEKILVAGGVNEGTQAVTVYAADSADNLISADNIVINETDVFAAVITPSTPIRARYIAFKFVGASNYARISELGAYGTAPDGTDKEGYILRTYANTNGAEKINRLMTKTNVIDSMPANVYETTDFLNGNAGAINNTNTAMTNGKIPGITDAITEEEKNPSKSHTYKGHWNSTTHPYLYYDLKGEATIEDILLAGSMPEEMPLGQVKIYMGNDPENLISDSNLIADETVGYASTLSLKTPVTCRYIAVHFLASYARVSELGFYSSTGYAQPTAPNGTKVTVTNINSPADRAVLETFTNQPNWLQLASAFRPTTHSEVPLKESVTNPLVQGVNDKAVVDNCVPGISNDEDSSNQKIYWNSDESPYLLFDMNMVCQDIQHILIAGSYTELLNYGMTLGEVKLYIGNDTATLIQDANCYADLTVSACSVVTLPESIDARYVAFWFGGNGGYARVSEVAVYSEFIPEAISLPNEFTADSPVGEGKVTIKIQRNLSDMYDATTLKSIKGVRLVEKDMPKDMPRSIDNGWLSPKGDKMYSLELYDKNGKAITFEEDHMIIVQLPNIDTEVNTMGIYKNGELTRPWNIVPTQDRKTMLVGQDFGNEGTLYYSEPIQLVYLTFNTPDETRELMDKQEYPHLTLTDDDGKTVIRY